MTDFKFPPDPKEKESVFPATPAVPVSFNNPTTPAVPSSQSLKHDEVVKTPEVQEIPASKLEILKQMDAISTEYDGERNIPINSIYWSLRNQLGNAK